MEKRTNEQWIGALRGPGRDEAIADLHTLLVRGLRGALSRRSGVSDAAIEDFVQESLIKILNNLDSFRGESRFTTWAQKVAVRVAFTELRRKEWRNVSLQEMTDRYDIRWPEPREMADPQPAPEELATKQIMFDTVRRLIHEELTERQREAMLYDARKRLKKRLISEGISQQDVLAMFGGK